MKLFTQMMLYALLGVFAQNMVFTRAVGSNRVLRLAKRPKDILLCSGLITVFTLLCATASYPLQKLFAAYPWALALQVLFYAAADCIFYFAGVALLKTVCKRWEERVMPVLATSAFNCIVLSVPLIGQQSALSLGQLAGYGVGTGIGFILAVLLVKDAISRLDNPDMPGGFLGLPGVFMYLGILSMAFIGFRF